MVEVKEVRDLGLLFKATESVRWMCSEDDLVTFLIKPQNKMFAVGKNVGLAKYEKPGVYIVHWYFTVKGREAIDLAKAMIGNLFDNYGAKTVIGLIKTCPEMKASRWACRQVGLKSYGMVTFADGDENEMFMVTKDQFKGNNNG